MILFITDKDNISALKYFPTDYSNFQMLSNSTYVGSVATISNSQIFAYQIYYKIYQNNFNLLYFELL